MTDLELKKLKDDLWRSADMLRQGAHLAANKFGQPILGLVFLRYADILFKQNKAVIEREYNRRKGTRTEKSLKEIAIDVCGFYLPEEAYFDSINNAPDTAEKAKLVKNAMLAIERENPEKLDGVLPTEVYGALVPKEEPDLLARVIKVFKDIPENIEIDLFGEIYEYFLGNFALAEGKDGGTFYTPSTVVRYMVNVLQPEPGNKMFLDPACGSGGMFVQAARYMHQHNASSEEMMKFVCYGVEKDEATVKLAKMNLLLNNVRGKITEANSFYADPYDAVGRFDYVMANPPFNVNEVTYDRVKDEPRFNTYGMTKGTKGKGGKEIVSNANYLWISYFATALNDSGKAALVMANTASDSGGNDLIIRQKMLQAGIIKQMVILPSNMFNTVTLPATLWFFDKNKPEKQKDEVLFINAKSIFTQVDRSHRKFSEEQIKNLTIITKLYDGDKQAFEDLLLEYREAAKDETMKSYFESQIQWLEERFPKHEYEDVIGLCKVAKIGEIKDSDGNIIGFEEDSIGDQDYSLNAGRYVGVVIEDDGMTQEDFKKHLFDLNKKLNKLNDGAKDEEDKISSNLEILFK